MSMLCLFHNLTKSYEESKEGKAGGAFRAGKQIQCKPTVVDVDPQKWRLGHALSLNRDRLNDWRRRLEDARDR